MILNKNRMKKIIYSLILITFCINANAQVNMSLLGSLSYSQDLNDIWGYADTLGNEYALVGTVTGVSIVDVTNPASPVELHFIPGSTNTWRDLKFWNNFAYAVSEANDGLLIVDLTHVQDSAPHIFTNCGVGFTSAHNIYIDEFGVAYLFGSNGALGTLMLDVDTDPWNPSSLGNYTTNYIHDGMVANNILYAGEINAGQLAVIDVSNKAAPAVLATTSTLSNFTHATWINNDTTVVFTVDEVGGAFIEAYDISDLSNVQRLDEIQSNPGSGVIPHNVFNLDDFLVTSYYRDGVTIHDVSRPHNLIEVGNYDTYPQGSGNGFNGAWGVYPYLPSGNIIVSDIENGLQVLGPTYVRACYLEGVVTDSATGIPLSNATVQVLSTTLQESTDVGGDYATGTVTPGTYTVLVGKAGYITKSITGVVLTNGVLTQLDVELVSQTAVAISGSVVDTAGNGIPSATIFFEDPVSGQTYNVSSDINGNFAVASFLPGPYDVTAGKWGYVSDCSNRNVGSSNPVNIVLEQGYYDDFTFDYLWSVSGTATTGQWTRDEPVGTNFSGSQANPELDVSVDCSDQCYMTGNGGGSGGTDDVDNGVTTLTSPIFDLTGMCNPYVSFYSWFYTGGGSSAFDDSLIVSISDGTSTVPLVKYHSGSAGNSSWIFNNLRIKDYLAPTDSMSLIVETSDLPVAGHIVEAALDLFRIKDSVGGSGTLAIDPGADIVDVNCFGGSDGSIEIAVLGGVPPYSFLWSNGSTTQNLIGLAAGTYTIDVSDSECNTVQQSYSVSEPGQISTTTGKFNVSCNGVANGSAQATASGGGGAPYSYSWDTNPVQTTQIINDLSGGTYIVTVTDANGCTKTTSVNIFDPSAIAAFSIPNNPNNGDINLLVTGGIAPYYFNWSDGTTTEDLSGATPGLFYFCQVTDRNSCAKIHSLIMPNPNAIPPPVINKGEQLRMALSDDVKVFPNPADENVAVVFAVEGGASYDVSIRDISGKLLIRENGISEFGDVRHWFDVSGLSKGMYFIEVARNTGRKVQKLIIR